MALRVNDSIRYFPNIRTIRDAQMKAAARSGAIFWDAWESMGGRGSIIKWFQQMPALASRDLTHLSNAGADTLAARIYSELLIARAEAAVAADQTADTADTIFHGAATAESPATDSSASSLQKSTMGDDEGVTMAEPERMREAAGSSIC
ncbi:MAG: hypothetical protein U5L72_16695 [Bacteroidales bacterium]|nr:hypothetical protein [Bacteroidales bacterium]